MRIQPRRPPDFVVGTPDDPYLKRWWIIPRNRWFNIYLHQFFHSDEDRALHDHPWVNCSILLAGSYVEHMRGGRSTIRRPWRPTFRLPGTAHRIEIMDGKPVWTLFITGPRVREWGFHCPKGWVHWEVFTKRGSPGEVGPGCDG